MKLGDNMTPLPTKGEYDHAVKELEKYGMHASVIIRLPRDFSERFKTEWDNKEKRRREHHRAARRKRLMHGRWRG